MVSLPQDRKVTAPLSRARKSRHHVLVVPLLVIFAVVSMAFGLLYLGLKAAQREPTDIQKKLRLMEPATELVSSPHELLQQDGVRNKDIHESPRDPPSVVVLRTSLGNLKIQLRPDLSAESVQYVQDLAASGACPRCNFYRAEKPGILQGILANPDQVPLNTHKGPCPSDASGVENKCPPHDVNCACHGPTMTRGMVGWAGGGSGPDFFVDMYKRPATWWGTQHIVWGKVEDEASLQLIERIWDLPVHKAGLTMLDEKIEFSIALE